MGGKNDEVAPPDVTAPPDNTAMMMQMMQMMMSAPAFQAPELPDIPEAPAVEAEERVDWKERTQQLASKVKADYTDEQSRKRGRSSTLLTSPLLDEDLAPEPSLIAGG